MRTRDKGPKYLHSSISANRISKTKTHQVPDFFVYRIVLMFLCPQVSNQPQSSFSNTLRKDQPHASNPIKLRSRNPHPFHLLQSWSLHAHATTQPNHFTAPDPAKRRLPNTRKRPPKHPPPRRPPSKTPASRNLQNPKSQTANLSPYIPGPRGRDAVVRIN